MPRSVHAMPLPLWRSTYVQSILPRPTQHMSMSCMPTSCMPTSCMPMLCIQRITSDMPAVAIGLKRVLQRHVDSVKSSVSQSENWHVAKNYRNSHMPFVAGDTRTSCPMLLKWRAAQLITRDTPLLTKKNVYIHTVSCFMSIMRRLNKKYKTILLTHP
jgi:hypothetical protein